LGERRDVLPASDLVFAFLNALIVLARPLQPKLTLFAFAALHELNTSEIASIVGTPVALDLSPFKKQNIFP